MAFPSPGADWPKIDAYLKGLGIRIDAPTFGETEGGNHVAGSEHYQHRARDYPVSSCDAPAVARALQSLAHGPGFVIDELFFSPLHIWYDSGTAYVPSATAIERVNHYNHCHAGCIRGAVFPGTPHPQPQPTPTPPPVAQEDDDEMSMFIRARTSPTVYERAAGGRPVPVGSGATLLDLWGLGFGHSPIPPGHEFDPYWLGKGIPVVLVEQRFVDDLT